MMPPTAFYHSPIDFYHSKKSETFKYFFQNTDKTPKFLRLIPLYNWIKIVPTYKINLNLYIELPSTIMQKITNF